MPGEAQVRRAALLGCAAPRGPGKNARRPEPRAAGSPLNNLPIQLTGFIGRAHELAEVRQLIAAARLLTLTGPGGCGKTRLAYAVAAELSPAFEDGICWVELAPLADEALVLQTVAFALGVREQPGRALADVLSDHLRSRRALLILDNCEHLVGACAQLADALLRACPRLQILATSRESLGIAGETLWSVPPLSLPRADGPAPATDLVRYDAVRFFLERARSVLPTLSLTDQDLPAVAQVCGRLDGMPLAIELAAARVKLLSLPEIADRVNDCFRLLTAGSRTALPRHRTLRATIDWSYGLLSDQERTLFGRLAVFAGGFTVEATEAVCSGDGIERDAVLDLLSCLVDKSLVMVQERGERARYRLLETIRQYARERLDSAGEASTVRQHHADHFARLAEQTGPKINGVERGVWLERLAAEHDNLRAALQWAAESADVETGIRIAGALSWFWFHRGHWSEGRGWLEAMLARMGSPREPAPSLARVKALFGAGWLAFAQGDLTVARARLEQSVAVCRLLGAGSHLAESLSFLALQMVHQGDPAGARPLAEESVAILRRGGERWSLAIALTNLGIVAEALKDYAQAGRLFEQSVALFRELGDGWGLSLPLRHLGYVVSGQGDYARAAALFKESLALLRDLGEKWFLSLGLEDLAEVECLQGDHGRAARLLGASEALRDAVGAAVRRMYQADYERAVAAARTALGEAAFAAAWTEGRAMTPEQAVAYALETPTVSDPADGGLQAVQRTEVLPSPAPELRICMLGAVSVSRRERPLTTADWGYAKPRELLCYLLCHPPQTKEAIGLAFWPDVSPVQLRSGLHAALHRLRRVLGRPNWVIFENGRYTFNRALDYWFDVEVFESHIRKAQRQRLDAPMSAAHHLEEAVKLYRGELMEGSDGGDWHLPRQAELRQMYENGLVMLGQLRFAAGDYAQAAEAYRRAIAHDGYLELAHRELMRCHARMGERGLALRHYHTFAERLKDDLGAAPARETTELFARLRRGEDV